MNVKSFAGAAPPTAPLETAMRAARDPRRPQPGGQEAAPTGTFLPGGWSARVEEALRGHREGVDARRHDVAVAVGTLALVAALYGRLFLGRPFTSDDFGSIYHRIPGYLDALAAGQWPPRVFPFAFDGAGYAFPHFYPPLGHWLATALGAITGSPIWGVHLAFILAVLGAALSMFALVRLLTGSAATAAIAAVMYSVAPYHLADVFMRGALAESWAFVWFPAIGWGAARTVRDERLHWGFPLAVTGLLLSHAVLSLYFAIFCAGGVLWIWRSSGRPHAVRLLAGAAIGASLTLWHFLPSQGALPSVRAGIPELMHATVDHVRRAAARPGNSFFLLDLIPWLIVGLGVRAAYHGGRPAIVRSGGVPALLGAGLAFTIFAYFPGVLLPALPRAFDYVQFPWRLFAVTAFIATLLTSLILSRIATARYACVVVIVSCLPGVTLSLLMGGSLPSGASPIYAADGATTYDANEDYMPNRVHRPEVLHRIASHRSGLEAAGVTMVREDGALRLEPRGQWRDEAVLPVFYYDFYSARDAGGEPVPMAERDGFVVLLAGGREGPITLRVVNPPSFYAGVLLGGIGLLVLVAYVFRARGPTLSGVAVRLLRQRRGSR